MQKKLILFIHGLGGSKETWGKFPELIKEDGLLTAFDVAVYEYPTSLVQVKSLIAPFSKLLSLFIPPSNLPTIQDIAEGLTTEIRHRYADYEEIYLVTHSMGGLIARKYLIDIIKAQPDEIRIKKLLLYAVPNNGSDWAELGRLYKHTQIEQLAKKSDFMTLLNKENRFYKLEEYLDVLYVVGLEDSVVNEQSALGFWGNTNYDSVHKGHMNIVKPTDVKDISYLIFKDFVQDKRLPRFTGKSEIPNLLEEEVKNSPFVKEVFASLLTQKPLMVLYYQKFTRIVKEKRSLKQQAYHTFNENVFELEIPTFQEESTYFGYLAEACKLSGRVDSSVRWKDALKQKLENGERLLLLISEIDNGNRELNTLLSNDIRALQTNHENLFVLFIGRKKLAYLVHGENELSPLNGATELFFPLQNLLLEEASVVQILEKVKEDCDLLCDNIGMEWVAYSTTKVIRTLFWKNLLKNQEGHFAWQNDEVERVVKRYCGCE